MVEQAASAQRQHVALFVATISAFIAPFLGSAVSVALPSIGREFHMDAVTLGWISTAYLLVAAIALVPIGRLGDIHGRKRVWLWGIAIYTVFSLLCAAAPSGPWLIVCRCLQAVGGTLIFGCGMAILTSVIPREKRGRALGINVAAVYAGLSAGPFLGGLLTDLWGWRSIFLVTVPLGLIAIGLILWLAVKATLAGLSIQTIGVILAIVGVVWLVIELFQSRALRRRVVAREERPVVAREERPVAVRDREVL
jgi:MFS family permease